MMQLVDGCATYGSTQKSILHCPDNEIHGIESERTGNVGLSQKEEVGNKEPSNDSGLSSDVAVQVSLSLPHDGEFTFSCLWDTPRSALLQCNIIDGWVIGVPKIPVESSGQLADSPIKQTDYEPPAKIRLRNEEPTVNITSKIRQYHHSLDEPVDTMFVGQKSKRIEGTFSSNKTKSSVKSKSVQVHLPINPTCESLRLSASVDQSLLEDCSGFHGYCSIKPGIDWKLESLCGIKKVVFDRYLSKVNPTAPWGPDNKTALLIFLVKLKSGLSFSNLAVFFGSDKSRLSKMFDDTLDKIHLRTEKDIAWPTGLFQKELPPYFQGLYKESRVILVCLEIEVEQPEDKLLGQNLFSSTSRIYSYKVVIGMTPVGRVCFKSKPYEGRKSFKRVLKDSGFLSKLNSKEVVLTRSIKPEMEFMVRKGVLLLAPQPSNDSGEDNIERDIGLHIERCEKRLKFFRVLQKIPIALSSKVDELLHVCCCLINELPPLLRHDQLEDEEF